MNKELWASIFFYLSWYIAVASCYANTIYTVFTLDSRTNLMLAGLVILLIDSAFVIIYFIFCFIIEPGEVKYNINIRDLSEESKYTPSDCIDENDVIPAKVHLCTSCNLCRPPHAIHCYSCKRCVFYRYNHNFFFRKCIGYYNFKFHANLYLYIAIGSIIVFALNYEVMKNTKAPSYGLDVVFTCIYSGLAAFFNLAAFLDMIRAATDISYLLEKKQDIYGSASLYENFQIFFGEKSWTWLLPIKVSEIESLFIDLRLNTHYGGVIQLHDKFII
ncbi:unnamed protein product [Blepharisma stoltei]|uniref:Palmitoyltransferase n=1 Tax=Blepharisma stoltei TaxID=1481888 RepID=A0AAU9JLT1_9CILI|nr:unnamed protein product [Blepharisma stoltei]